MTTDTNEIFILYVLIYITVSFCYVFRSSEFISAGLTIEHMFNGVLGQENEKFVQYHIIKICLTLVTYCLIPFGFFVGLLVLNVHKHFVDLVGSSIFIQLVLVSTVLVFIAVFVTTYWYVNNWIHHPVIKSLLPYCSSNHWDDIVEQINAEYKRIEKLILQCGPRTKLVITENWIISVGMTSVNFARQNDSELLVCKENTHYIVRTGHITDDFHESISSAGVIQYLDIQVKRRCNNSHFIVRINALDFKNLKDSLSCPVTVSPNVVFYQTKIEMFLELFQEIVQSNPIYEEINAPDECVGCFSTTSNVKLVKRCNEAASNVPDSTDCWSCKCRPMWCTHCMGKWFASRQDQRDTSNWLSSKCTCPMCRAVFCMLDVCPVKFISQTDS